MLRETLIRLSENDRLRHFVSTFGPARRMSRRFVAGETLDEAVAVIQDLNRRGIKGIFNLVGEEVSAQDEAATAVQAFIEVLERIKVEGLEATISVKPSHLGLAFGENFYYETAASIVEAAQARDILVEIDVEGSADVPATLSVYERLLEAFPGSVRQAVSAYFHRTPGDIERLAARGANIRLVKGAYREPPEIAIQDKNQITQVSKQLISAFFSPQARAQGAYLALGSHDSLLIDWLLQEAEAHNVPKSGYEIQMLQGVRRDEQQRLAGLGYQVRIYVPFGDAWYPYFMRRLAERPANLLFIARALFKG
jgi:proline dehydrogenase